MVHVNEHGRDFTTFENISRSWSFPLRQHSHQYCLFHLTEFEQSKTLQLLNISKCSFTFVCDAYQRRKYTFVCMNRLHEQQSSEMNHANCFHFYRFLMECQKQKNSYFYDQAIFSLLCKYKHCKCPILIAYWNYIYNACVYFH